MQVGRQGSLRAWQILCEERRLLCCVERRPCSSCALSWWSLGSFSLCGSSFTILPLSVLSLPRAKHLGLSSCPKDKFESFHPLSFPASELLSLHCGHLGAENSCRYLSWAWLSLPIECQQHLFTQLSAPKMSPGIVSCPLGAAETHSSTCTAGVWGSPGPLCKAVSEHCSSQDPGQGRCRGSRPGLLGLATS